MDSSTTEGLPSRSCSPALPTPAAGSQDVTTAPSSSYQSCSTVDVQPCSESSGGQGALSQGLPCSSFSHAPGPVAAHSMVQHRYTQVIYFLELLLQCFVQKAPSNKLTQVSMRVKVGATCCAEDPGVVALEWAG
eukprot:1151197-Pelagomonas_calceolata.AAC.4